MREGLSRHGQADRNDLTGQVIPRASIRLRSLGKCDIRLGCLRSVVPIRGRLANAETNPALFLLEIQAVTPELVERPRPIPFLDVDEAQNQQVLHFLHFCETEISGFLDRSIQIDAGSDVRMPALDQFAAEFCRLAAEVQDEVDAPGRLKAASMRSSVQFVVKT